MIAAAAATASLAACGGPGYPPTVFEGTAAVVAWDGALTSVNAASVSGATPGNLDVERLTRAQFAREREGEITVDPLFGEVAIEVEDETDFVVSFDLADPVWSDGIAIDAADLMLAWAAGSDFFSEEEGEDPLSFASIETGMRLSDEIPSYDEFDKRIEVSFERPIVDWRTALDVAVPAHAVGLLALGVEDPMEAKTAVIDAIAGADADALAKIAETWNEGFDVTGDIGQNEGGELTLSSGPFRVEQIEGASDQRVSLVANGSYVGAPTASYERIVLQRETEPDVAADIGETYDIVQVPPRADDFLAIRDLERTDYGVDTTDRGEVWVVLARVDGASRLSDTTMREVFLRAFDRGDMIDDAAGEWEDAYATHSSVLFAPGSDGYQIALEDAGFGERFRSRGNAFDEREAAGIPPKLRMCVLYDTGSAFARGLFASLERQLPEAGWGARDCGSDDVEGMLEMGGDWDILLTKIAIPETPAEIAAQWGTGGSANHAGAVSEKRDALIAELERETDQYEARDLRVAIEKTIVEQMVAAPLSMDPIITVSDRGMEGVLPRSGRVAPLFAGATEWRPADRDSPVEDQPSGEDDDGLL
ncbi:hypothetical protein [Microbacterium suaedae]|uniref:hypothetical protein n=1 Tax=Microbacterium suaedae TaxID=2067813 RepID=UPI0013A670B3|nr:hypothetical protein [Microbacterium suaedae]